MELSKLWEKVKTGFALVLDYLLKAIYYIMEKLGEFIKMLKLRSDKAGFEQKITNNFIEIGKVVYDKLPDNTAQELGIKDFISQISNYKVKVQELDKEIKEEIINNKTKVKEKAIKITK